MRRSRRKGQWVRSRPPGQIALDDQHLFSGAALHDHPAARIGDEAAAPELDAAVRRALEPDPVHGADVDAVGDGVASLDGFPRGLLLRAVLLLFGRQPADGGGIEQDLGAAQRGEPGGFGIPLIPAHQHADAAEPVSQERKPRSPGVK